MPEPAVTPEVQVDTVAIPEESKTLLSEAVTESAAEVEPKEAEPAKEEEKQSAPESYADFTLPEGFALNDEVMVKAKDFFKGKNLTQEDAQALVNLQVEVAQKQLEQAEADFKGIVEGWKSETVKMLGADYQKKMVPAAAFRNKFAPEGFEDFLNTTGLGNHPMFIQMCINAGEGLLADAFVRGEEKPKVGPMYNNSPGLKNE